MLSQNPDAAKARFPDLILQIGSSMKYPKLRIGLLTLGLAFLATPLVIVFGAGGRIEGKVTDPKAAIVVGATITVTDPATNKTFTAKTDKVGRYTIEGLPPGNYSVVVSAQGFSEVGAAYHFVVYPKGAYILHMLRQMMFDPRKDGDKLFMAMMQDFIKSHYNEDVSTEDFKKTVEKHMTKQMDLEENRRMDWFFNEWVYGTEIPSYKFEYQLGDGTILSAHLTQSGVSANFKMLVPVYVDFGKGWSRIGAATMIGNSSVDLKDIKLPQAAKRAAICAHNDVLALNIQNAK